MPTEFAAHGNATTRVRSESSDVEVGEVDAALVVDVGEAHDDPKVVLQLEPRRDVRVVVEPRDDDLVAGPQSSRATVRVSAKLSVDMFGPKITSSAPQPRNPAAASRASAMSASVRRLVSYGPLVFALDSRR